MLQFKKDFIYFRGDLRSLFEIHEYGLVHTHTHTRACAHTHNDTSNFILILVNCFIYNNIELSIQIYGVTSM